MKTVIIADDHPMTLLGTQTFVKELGYNVIHIADNGITALNLINAYQPDIAILDVSMPGMDGLEVLSRVQKGKVHTKVVLQTMHKEVSIYRKAKELNVYGYVLKEYSQTELQACLLEVANGNKYISTHLLQTLESDATSNKTGLDKLTLTERKIVELIAKGKTSKQISEMLFTSEKTVEGHRGNIVKKLEIPAEKNALLMWAMKNVT